MHGTNIKKKQISYLGGGGLNQNSECLLKRNWVTSVLLFNILLKNARHLAWETRFQKYQHRLPHNIKAHLTLFDE